MIQINENWEQVNDLSDVVRIISENISDEFAREVERICDDRKLVEELEEEINSLNSDIDDLECQLDDYDNIADRLDYLNEQLDKLKKYIEENKDGTDFMNGIIKAYDMIER